MPVKKAIKIQLNQEATDSEVYLFKSIEANSNCEIEKEGDSFILHLKIKLKEGITLIEGVNTNVTPGEKELIIFINDDNSFRINCTAHAITLNSNSAGLGLQFLLQEGGGNALVKATGQNTVTGPGQ